MSQCEVRPVPFVGGYIDNLFFIWVRRLIEGHVGSFVRIIFNVNLFSCLLSTDIRTFATSRLTKHIFLKWIIADAQSALWEGQ